jgi:hypothetical protein
VWWTTWQSPGHWDRATWDRSDAVQMTPRYGLVTG